MNSSETRTLPLPLGWEFSHMQKRILATAALISVAVAVAFGGGYAAAQSAADKTRAEFMGNMALH